MSHYCITVQSIFPFANLISYILMRLDCDVTMTYSHET
jgi:hypothetical protein